MTSVRTALGTFRRAPLLSALSITTIAFSLFAFGLFGLVALNIRHALQGVEDREEIRAFVADGTSDEQLQTLADQVGRYREVASATVVTQEDALQQARTELSEFADVFESQVLPASVEIRLRPGHRDPASVRDVVNRVRERDVVKDVRYGAEWITQLYRLRNIAEATGAALGLAFAAVAIIIIGATIRMAVLSRSREISIMRLVGATDGFIRRPFLIEGSLKGAIGGALALGLTWFAMRQLDQYLHFQTVFFDRQTAVIGVVSGAFLGLLGSALSVG